MAKVAIVSGNPEIQTPSDEIIKKANAIHNVSDEMGRVISLKKPPMLAQYRLVEALGPDTAKNQVYMGMCMPLLYINAIDGELIEPLMNKRHVEALIQRLDEDGFTALMSGIEKHFGASFVTSEDGKEDLKK